ncbi:MAG: tyrosine-type recombinase/integrase, partial [Candidatus Methylomirabilales bacterium]
LRQHRQVAGVKESTGEEYEKVLRLRLLPAFGDQPINAITRGAVKAFVARLREEGSVRWAGKGLSAASVRCTITPLRLILGEAVDAGLLQANPAVRVGKWNRRRTEAEAEGAAPFNAAELRAIAKTVQDQVPLLWPLIGVWVQSGMREGEVFGLQWKDLDLDAGTAIVRRTLSKGRLGSPKTGRSRVVKFIHPLLDQPEAVLEALQALRSVREAEAAVAGQELNPEGFVFTRADGRPMNLDVLHSAWRRCLRLAGVRYRNPEQLRHTFASTLLSRGWPLLYVQAQGGWADATTLLKHYARWIPREAPVIPQPNATPAQLAS